jgi:hypothetical protein
MKITKNTIKKLIKEEMEAIIDEGGFVDQIKSIGQGVKSFGQDALNRAQQPSQKEQNAESLQHINAKLDQILHILNMTK